MTGTAGGTDAHIAAGLGGILVGEQAGGVVTVELLGGEVALLIVLAQILQECLVGIVVKLIVLTGAVCGVGVAGLHLLAHGDEPVGLGVIAQRNAIGIDGLDLLADIPHFVPSGGNGQVVLSEEVLVVEQDLGGLAQGHGVHQAVAEDGAFVVVGLNEVVFLSLGQTQDLAGVANSQGAVDQIVQGHNGLGQVVHSNMVGVAVDDVGLGAAVDLGGDGAVDVGPAALVDVFNLDVGVDLVELLDILVNNGHGSLTHGMTKGDGDFLGGIKAALGDDKVGLSVSGLITAGHSQHTKQHKRSQAQCYNSLFHSSLFPSFSFFMLQAVFFLLPINQINP